MDECAVGIMIKQTHEGVEKFTHFIGSDYGGGHALVAYLIAPFLHFIPLTDVLVQSATVLFSILFILVFSALVQKTAGYLAGILTAILVSLFPTYMKASFEVNGYVEALFFLGSAALILQILLEKKHADQRGSEKIDSNKYLLCLFGTTLGVALWSQEFAIIFFPVFGVILLKNARKFRAREVFIASIAFLLGYCIKINYLFYENATQPVFSRWARWDGPAIYLERMVSILRHIPAAFSPYIYRYSETVHTYSVILAVIIVVAMVLTACTPLLKSRKDNENSFVEVTLSLLAIYFVLLFALFQHPLEHPRYLLPLMPIVCGLVSVICARLIKKGRGSRVAGVIIISVFILAEIVGVVDMRTCQNNTCGDSVSVKKLIKFLSNDLHVNGIHTDYNTKWKVSFYSNENIIGSDVGFSNLTKYPKYDIKVLAMKNVPFVFPQNSVQAEMVKNRLDTFKVKYRSRNIAGYLIIFDLSGDTHAIGLTL